MIAYLYVCCVTRINLDELGRKNVILHTFMYNVMSDFGGAR